MLSDVANGATALGVLLTAAALFLSWRQSRTAFEDDLTRQYRQIAARIPLPALLEGNLVPLQDEKLRPFFEYVELTNEQTFLRKKGRVRANTWKDWCEGIKRNFEERDAFSAALQEISARSPEDFAELHGLIDGQFADPREPYPQRLWR